MNKIRYIAFLQINDDLINNKEMENMFGQLYFISTKETLNITDYIAIESLIKYHQILVTTNSAKVSQQKKQF